MGFCGLIMMMRLHAVADNDNGNARTTGNPAKNPKTQHAINRVSTTLLNFYRIVMNKNDFF